jgi:hypothetical protein
MMRRGVVSAQFGRRISRNMAFLKRLFPLLWLGVLASVVVVLRGALWQPGRPALPTAVLLVLVGVPLTLAVFGYFVTRHLVADLADEVFDEGEALRVRCGAEEERIALADIINVGYTQLVNPPRITLTLRHPGRFGREVSFSPQRRYFNPLRRNPLIDELIERVEAARRR